MLPLLVVAQLAVWHGPKLSPAEAARLLADSPVLSNKTHDPGPPPDGPTVTVIAGSVTGGPFGEFPRYETTYWQSAGLPLWGHGGYTGYGGYPIYGYPIYGGFAGHRGSLGRFGQGQSRFDGMARTRSDSTPVPPRPSVSAPSWGAPGTGKRTSRP